MRISNFLRYMDGPGGRRSQNGKIQGMDLKSVKHHTALIPLFAIMGLGMTWVAYYCFRLASSTTDVNWKKVHTPQEYYRNKQFKFYNSSGIDFEKEGCKAPIYRD
eukprot:02990.XXX_101774_101356_1 [CDS] Oithona nana genome sequencing.